MWKRRQGQKNCHLQAKVDPTKIFQALHFLKSCGNPHYQNIQSRDNYEARCLSEDPDGFDLVFGASQCEDEALKTIFIPDDAAEPIMELSYFLYLKDELETEKEYVEKDTVRKFQIEYTDTVCMVEKFPEAMHSENISMETSQTGTDESLQAVLPNNNYEAQDTMQPMLATPNEPEDAITMKST